MKNADLERYLRFRMSQMRLGGDLSSTEVAQFISMAVANARVDLWTAKPWTFRRHQYTLAISSEQDAYELPDNFAAIATSRENESLFGGEMVFLTKDEFDRRIPDPSAHAGGTPIVYTVYSDTTNKKKYIQFAPRPSSMSLYLNILITSPNDVSSFPESARAALIAVAQKYLFVPGTSPFDSAYGLAENEIRKMEIEDSPYAGDAWKFFDSTDEKIISMRPWV